MVVDNRRLVRKGDRVEKRNLTSLPGNLSGLTRVQSPVEALEKLRPMSSQTIHRSGADQALDGPAVYRAQIHAFAEIEEGFIGSGCLPSGDNGLDGAAAPRFVPPPFPSEGPFPKPRNPHRKYSHRGAGTSNFIRRHSSITTTIRSILPISLFRLAAIYS